MYSDIEITPEQEEELIRKTADKIHEYGMDTAAILLLESSKPLVWIGGEMGRFFITPFIPAVSESWGIKSETILRVFENRENVEKLMKRLEELTREDEKKKAEEKAAKKAAKEAEKAAKNNPKSPE